MIQLSEIKKTKFSHLPHNINQIRQLEKKNRLNIHLRIKQWQIIYFNFTKKMFAIYNYDHVNHNLLS